MEAFFSVSENLFDVNEAIVEPVLNEEVLMTGDHLIQQIQDRVDDSVIHATLETFGGWWHMYLLKPRVELLRILLKFGADINQRDDIYGRTPLMLAVQFSGKNVESARFLLDNGADIKLVDAEGRSTLDFAIQTRPSREIILLLIERGAVPLVNLRLPELAVPIWQQLLVHRQIFILCIPLSVPRLEPKIQHYTRDILRKLYEFLVER